MVKKMPTQVITSRNYDRRASRLLSQEARMTAEAVIVTRPDAWPIIQGTGGGAEGPDRAARARQEW
jgi:hypothetical protein